jgi:hypothetical protein
MRRFLCRRAAHAAQELDEASTSEAADRHAGTPTEREPSAGTLRAASRPAPAPSSPRALEGLAMPGVLFNNFDRRPVDLGKIAAAGLLLYVYPGCEDLPPDSEAGVAGDVLQHATYEALRERFAEAMPGGALVALSSIPAWLQLHHSPDLAWLQDRETPFEHYLISDETLQLAEELCLPTFEHKGNRYYQRLTIVARGGRIQRVFHPIVPGQDARQALAWLQLH